MEPIYNSSVKVSAPNPYQTVTTDGKRAPITQQMLKRTAYLQPTTVDMAKGNFGTQGSAITYEVYASQATSLSAASTIGAQLGIKTAAQSPLGGPEQFRQYTKEIQLEAMFGMTGSGSAANIRLAAAQTGASIPSLITFENERLGIRQELSLGKAAFSYDGTLYDKAGTSVGIDKTVAAESFDSPAANKALTLMNTSSVAAAAAVKAGPQLDLSTLRLTDIGAAPLFLKATIKPIINLATAVAGYSAAGGATKAGRDAALMFPSFLKDKVRATAFNTTYGSLYERSGENLTLTAAGKNIAAILKQGTPKLNVRINKSIPTYNTKLR